MTKWNDVVQWCGSTTHAWPTLLRAQGVDFRLDLYWTLIGRLGLILSPSWISPRPLLAPCWASHAPSTGRPLDLFTTPVLDLYSSSTASTGPLQHILLGFHWTFTGARLDPYWTSAGRPQELSWTSAKLPLDLLLGLVLAWPATGPLLGFDWTCILARLAWSFCSNEVTERCVAWASVKSPSAR